jgi:hypothetical protein
MAAARRSQMTKLHRCCWRQQQVGGSGRPSKSFSRIDFNAKVTKQTDTKFDSSTMPKLSTKNGNSKGFVFSAFLD